MSETTTDTSVSRPWYGSDSPFEALHDWMVKELTAIKTAANPTIKALETRIAELEVARRRQRLPSHPRSRRRLRPLGRMFRLPLIRSRSRRCMNPRHRPNQRSDGRVSILRVRRGASMAGAHAGVGASEQSERRSRHVIDRRVHGTAEGA